MTIYPAVDISDGKCVRLLQGELHDVTQYGDPLSVAKKWEREGARWVHVVDLDGAFSGEAKNLLAVQRIVSELSIPVQLGGGIRTRKDISDRLERLGVQRVVLGTVAVDDPETVAWAASQYPGRVAVGIDAREGHVSVNGWTKATALPVLDFARQMADRGVQTLIYTDIRKDGMMEGADTVTTRQLVENTPCNVIGSGGISALKDIRSMAKTGASGCIIGRALLSGAFTLQQAIGAANAYEADHTLS